METFCTCFLIQMYVNTHPMYHNLNGHYAALPKLSSGLYDKGCMVVCKMGGFSCAVFSLFAVSLCLPCSASVQFDATASSHWYFWRCIWGHLIGKMVSAGVALMKRAHRRELCTSYKMMPCLHCEIHYQSNKHTASTSWPAACYGMLPKPHIPLATGTHFIKSGLPVCPVFPFRAVYSSKTSTLRRFTQFMQFMQTEQFMQFMRFVLVYQKTGPDRSRPVLEQTA